MITGGRASSAGWQEIENERRPAELDYAQLEDMTNAPQIAGCLAMIKLPIVAIDWRISCRDKGNKEIPTAVHESFARIWRHFIRATLPGLHFGWSFQEKRWEMRDGLWQWKPFLSIHPRELEIKRRGNDFYGVKQITSGVRERLVRAEKAFVYTHGEQFGNMYGKPRTWGAYKPWWIWRHMIRFTATFYEDAAQPLQEGRVPAQVDRIVDGVRKKVDGLQYFLDEVLNKLGAGKTKYVLPSERDDKGNYLYDLLYKETQKRGIEWIDFLAYLDVMMSRGMLMPDLAIFQSRRTGARAMAQTHSEMFWAAQEGLIDEIKGFIDTYIIRQFIDYNFGIDAPDCFWEYSPVSPETVTWLKMLVERMVSGNTVRPDLNELEDRLGIPLEEVEAPQGEGWGGGYGGGGNGGGGGDQGGSTEASYPNLAALTAESGMW